MSVGSRKPHVKEKTIVADQWIKVIFESLKRIERKLDVIIRDTDLEEAREIEKVLQPRVARLGKLGRKTKGE